MEFNPGFEIAVLSKPMDFQYGQDTFGPDVEYRKLNDIRKSLLDPDCEGPEIVYAVAMDVGKKKHLPLLRKMFLLYGAVTFSAGKLGNEPVRSQGHVHIQNPRNNWSTPEVYEIWEGKAIVLMQEKAAVNPGRCYAVYAQPGQVVIVPPGWAHATINADINKPLCFGAWCDRQYGFEYDDIRERHGLAWYPILNRHGQLAWQSNKNYQKSRLIEKGPNSYESLGLVAREGSIYSQFEKDFERFLFVPEPHIFKNYWENFIP